MSSMSEKEVEQRLVAAVKAVGGWCPKFISPGINGMPDRIVLIPGGRIGFIEVKAPGQKPRKLQIRRHIRLRNLGFLVFVLDDPKEIPDIITAIQEGDR